MSTSGTDTKPAIAQVGFLGAFSVLSEQVNLRYRARYWSTKTVLLFSWRCKALKLTRSGAFCARIDSELYHNMSVLL